MKLAPALLGMNFATSLPHWPKTPPNRTGMTKMTAMYATSEPGLLPTTQPTIRAEDTDECQVDAGTDDHAKHVPRAGHRPRAAAARVPVSRR